MTIKIVHVEMYDGQTFCGDGMGGVGQRDWHEDPQDVAQGNCLRCLERIAALGAAADAARVLEMRRGATVEIQREIMQAEQAERERRWKESGAQTMTLAGFDAILKERY